MPKIPSQLTRRAMPSIGGGGNARSIATKAGQGLQAAGAAIASDSAQLGHAFAVAQARRDAINAHLDSLAQQTQAQQITLDSEAGMQQDRMDIEEQLRKQQDTDPRFWKVKIKNQDGEDIEVSPDDGMQILLQNRYDKAKNDADQYAGPEAKARVAMALEQQSFNNLSAFRSSHLKLRHDKQLADWQTVAARLGDQAADPTNAFRETAKQDLDDHITNGIKAGIFSPTDGVKMKETMKATIADKWATQTALRDPVGFLKMINETQAQAQGDGMAVPAGKLKKLPEDLTAEKLPQYMQVAFGALQHQQNEIDRKNKALEAQTKQRHEQTFRADMARVLNGESVAGGLPTKLNENNLSAEQGNTLRAAEHAFKTQNAEDPELKKTSAVKLFDYTANVTKAKFGVGNLEDLEIQVSVDLARGEMLPGDAKAVLDQLRDAQGHLQSEAKQVQNQAVQAAHKNMMSGLTTSGPMDKYDALSEQAKEGADRDFWHVMSKNPNADPWQIREQIMKRWEPVIAERKNVLGDTAQVKLDDAKLDSLVARGAMSKAGAKAVRERQENEKGRKIVSDFLSTYKPPEPTIWEKMKNLGQIGSSWFQDADAGASE
jgi:hypothetical protein